MYKLLIVACLLSIIHGTLSQEIFDESTYNPCGSQAGLFFYSHPVDVHKYYQCDDNGNAFIRSCGDLVWDSLRLACNWPSAVIFPSSTTTDAVMLPTFFTTRQPAVWPVRPDTFTTTRPTTIAFAFPTARPITNPFAFPTARPITNPFTFPTTPPTTTPFTFPTARPTTTVFTFPTETVPTTSSTISPEILPTILPPVTPSPSSLCQPDNPCGEHGVCVESIRTIPKTTPRFACICSDNWFGRLCDRQIAELTTPASISSDQNQTIVQQNVAFHFPIQTRNDSRLVFYGLKASKIIPLFNRTFTN